MTKENRYGRSRSLVVAFIIGACMLWAAVCVPTASADFGTDAFEFGVIDQAGLPYGQAGGHPFQLDVNFLFRTTTDAYGNTVPDENMKDVHIVLPPGLVGNPNAAAQCTLAQLDQVAETGTGSNPACPVGSVVGQVEVHYASGASLTFAVFNMKPPPGAPARFGFNVWGFQSVLIDSNVRTGGDYAVVSSATNLSTIQPVVGAKMTLWGVPADPAHDPRRCVLPAIFPAGQCTGTPGDIKRGPNSAGIAPTALLTLPTDCTAGPLTARLYARSWQNMTKVVSATSSASTVTGCDQLQFEPSVGVRPDGKSAASPTGLNVEITLPQGDQALGLVYANGRQYPPTGLDYSQLATSNLKDVKVTLPEGVSVNPAAASGLAACAPGQIGIDNDAEPRCPGASKIGSVTVDTPLLPVQMKGAVYQAEQNNNPFHDLLAIYVVAKGSGALIKLAGHIVPDPRTGQLTATFDNNPQLPFSKLTLSLKGGARAPLTTPDTCGTFKTESEFTSWSGKTVRRSSPMAIDQGCAGLGWFGPYFSAGTVNPAAGVSSPFVLRVNKPDGQSALNGIGLSLPEGLLGNLKGNIGRQVGTARVAAGVGPDPFWLSGPVVLEGPYGDAPFSLRVTVPAIAGPFNLGDVVVRQKIYVDPHDAHVTVVSDPLPTILQGIPVQLHDLAVDIDKAGFMRNPTSCAPKSIGGTLGAVTGQTAAVASRFQVGDCANLPLAPKMRMDLVGEKETSRGKHPELSTTLTQQSGESALKQVKVRLPLSLALDPDNAEALCKPEQAAAKACPAASIVGHATAVTPLLDQPLKGDVFFVEGTRKSKTGRTVKTLPKLWVALRGQVAIDLWADSSISKGKYLVTTFPFVPDAPISSFKLDINGGQHGILAVTGDTGANLCKQANVTQATYDGQNGKQVVDNIRMTSPCGFRVRSKSLTKTHAKVTLSGLGAGKLSISGKGIHKAHRTIKHSDVATITPRLTESGMRTAKRGKALRLRVTWNPKEKGAKTRHAKATVKRAKKESSTRAHRRSHRTR